MELPGSFITVFFFYLLGQDLVDCFNASLRAGEMSLSQRRGVITIIPKERRFGPLPSSETQGQDYRARGRYNGGFGQRESLL